MKLKFLEKKKKFRKGGFGIKPDLYWRYIFYLTFLLFLLSLFFGWYLFRETTNEPVLPAVNTGQGSSIKKERIDSVLEFFKEREKKSIEILNSPSPIIDPSL